MASESRNINRNEAALTNSVSWFVELNIRQSDIPKFLALNERMVARTREENGALIYERFMNFEQGKVFIYERYASPENALEHLKTFQTEFGDEFERYVERNNFILMGNVNRELASKLAELGAVKTDSIGGFSKQEMKK